MTQMCGDPKMLQAYKEGKDLYAQIAALAFDKSYKECYEFYIDDAGNYIDLDGNIVDKEHRVTYKEGKERRSQAKSILLGILYGRGIASIAEQLNCSKEKAQQIQDKVFKGFPAIPKFEEDSKQMAKEKGYVTTLWGRKRRLPNMQLLQYEFDFTNCYTQNVENSEELENDIIEKYTKQLNNSYSRQAKEQIKQKAYKEGIIIKDNGGYIADAERQCVNSRIQGSAADMSKKAMILIGNDKRLKELGFRLLIPVHDELIAECPIENAKECEERFARLMNNAAKDRLEVPISCDVEVTKAWYGEPIEI